MGAARVHGRLFGGVGRAKEPELKIPAAKASRCAPLHRLAPALNPLPLSSDPRKATTKAQRHTQSRCKTHSNAHAPHAPHRTRTTPATARHAPAPFNSRRLDSLQPAVRASPAHPPARHTPHSHTTRQEPQRTRPTPCAYTPPRPPARFFRHTSDRDTVARLISPPTTEPHTARAHLPATDHHHHLPLHCLQVKLVTDPDQAATPRASLPTASAQVAWLIPTPCAPSAFLLLCSACSALPPCLRCLSAVPDACLLPCLPCAVACAL